MLGMACSSSGSETSEAVKDQTRWTRVKATRQCEAGEPPIRAAHFNRDGRLPWDTNSLTNGGWACHSVRSRVPAGASIPALSSASTQRSRVDWGNSGDGRSAICPHEKVLQRGCCFLLCCCAIRTGGKGQFTSL